jgi:hypothetical protein
MPRFLWAFSLVLIAASPSAADFIVIDPNSYPEGANLSNPVPRVHLSTALQDNGPVSLFTVEATTDTVGSLTTRFFSHVGIPFFNDIRRLRIDFDDLASSVSVNYIDSGFFGIEFAHLEAFNAQGQLLQSVNSSVNPTGVAQLLSINRSTNDIAFAVAFSDGLTFGRFDLITADVGPVPEPNTLVLAGTGIACLMGAAWRRRRRECETTGAAPGAEL